MVTCSRKCHSIREKNSEIKRRTYTVIYFLVVVVVGVVRSVPSPGAHVMLCCFRRV